MNKAEIIWIEGRLVFEIDGKPILDKNGRSQPAPISEYGLYLEK